ncbi:hypothetical protein [Protofrankia coriariae]|uniref:Uncharacterized protein n=1 Tax=Protofrankia coriariae TaxID=1562887 RepID=A0ABR5F7D1_9ACTN|nr:hypothetical protein [Protofrankia coriariae]KLL12626.1 hypothetical protein FrCorBMG51_02800 [Protofrankia coriariae]
MAVPSAERTRESEPYRRSISLIRPSALAASASTPQQTAFMSTFPVMPGTLPEEVNCHIAHFCQPPGREPDDELPL